GELEVRPLDLALLERAMDESGENNWIDGLLQVVESAGFDRSDRTVDRGVARHEHDDGLRLQIARGSEHEAAFREAVEHDVGDDRVERDRLEQLARVGGRARERGLQPLVLEHRADEVERARVVVDEEHGGARVVRVRHADEGEDILPVGLLELKTMPDYA